MKISLINPPVDFNLSLGKLKKIAATTKMLPLGLGYIAGVAKKHGFDVEIIDSYAEDLTIDETVSRVLKNNSQVVGISTVTPTVPSMLAIAKGIKDKSNGRPPFIVSGGAHANIMPGQILETGFIDVAVRGEGELTFLELIKNIERNDKDFSAIRGISYKKEDKIFHNPDRQYVEDLDSLPYPAYELFKMHLYSAPLHWLVAEPAYQMIISRGCPFQCIFCGIKALGRVVRARSVENALDEIEFLHKNYGAKEIMLVDPAFPLSKNLGIEFCMKYIKRGLHKKVFWVTETRVDVVDFDLLKLMYKAGCRLVEFGIETGSEKTLKKIKKNTTLRQARNAIMWSKQAGLEVFSSFIIGFPGETLQDMQETVDFIKSSDIDYPKVNLLVPYPGSAVYDDIIKERPDISMEWDKYTSFSSMTDNAPVYVPDGISADELQSFHKRAYKQIYLRPRFIFNHIKKLKSFLNIRKYCIIISTFIRGIF